MYLNFCCSVDETSLLLVLLIIGGIIVLSALVTTGSICFLCCCYNSSCPLYKGQCLKRSYTDSTDTYPATSTTIGLQTVRPPDTTYTVSDATTYNSDISTSNDVPTDQPPSYESSFAYPPVTN